MKGNREPEDIKWHYYLEEAEQEPEVQAQLAEIRKEYAALTPDQLKVIEMKNIGLIQRYDTRRQRNMFKIA